MTRVILTDRDRAIDLLTTHRHGEHREACRWCAAFYGDILDRLAAAGLLTSTNA